MPQLYKPCVEHPLVEPQREVSACAVGVDELGAPVQGTKVFIVVNCLYCGQRFTRGTERLCRLQPVGGPTPPEVAVPASRRRR